MIIIDAKGKNCPIPVIMAKKEIDSGCKEFIVLVDNNIAVQNLNRLATNQGYNTQVEEAGGTFRVSMSTECAECKPILSTQEDLSIPHDHLTSAKDYAVFAGKDYIGEGSKELGSSLMKMFFYTLSESSDLPHWILFMNSGVKLPALDPQIIDHLKILEGRGVEILVCGACLNYYQIPGELPVGMVSNMYDILERMQRASKVITI